MNVNGSRFDLLLGRPDWARCLDGDREDARTLGWWWDGAASSPPVELPPALPYWDPRSAELSIRPSAIELPGTTGEVSLTLDARRGAAADRNGNVYRIAGDRSSLLVTGSGTRHESTFWPVAEGCEVPRASAQLDFLPGVPDESTTAETYLALAATADDYLVVAFASGGVRGFLSFDLVAGGTPVSTLWPSGVHFEPLDMSARCGGGVWVLDRADGLNYRLWELDCRLAVVATAAAAAPPAAEPEDFQPLAGPLHECPPVMFPTGLELTGSPAWTADPIAVETLGEGTVLLLDRDPTGKKARVVRLRREGSAWVADASRWLDELPDSAHDFLYAGARVHGHEEPVKQLFIVTASGNQARAYSVLDEPDEFILRGATELFPLRRFGGRALVAIKGIASYDSGLDAMVWTPIVHQPRARFEQFAELVTPVFDSGELGNTWDRLLLDACLPAGTSVEILSRAGDERSDLLGPSGWSGLETPQVVGTWLPEPSPHLRTTGSELPWLRGEASRETRREAGVGTWEVLLQRARGRYLQLQVRLASATGNATPRIRALRVWWPRFSYPQRFLPAVYREDERSGSLLERWLANCESTLTLIEDRVTTVQALFDPRAAPAETLAWLAEWLDIAFDPTWDERRRRLFVRHALDLFRWRGTVLGLRLALELAFDECFDPDLFEGPAAAAATLQRIRIVEAYQTRLVGALVAGDPSGETGPREVRREALWTPREGNAGLAERLSAAFGRKATPVEQITPVSLVPQREATGQPAPQWVAFANAALGFVPAIGAAELARWRGFLASRYPTPADLEAKHGVAYGGFDGVRLPRDWPLAAQYASDWREFCALDAGAWMRARWQDFLARRYRRIQRLNRAYQTSWPGLEVVAIPDALPDTAEAQADWLQFERQVLPMHTTAHRFSVLLPVSEVTSDPAALEVRLGLARRIVELEKPAHTVFDVRFYWAFFRIGAARLEIDTLLGRGSRAPELIPAAVLGRAYVGSGFVGGPPRPVGGDRLLLAC